MGFLTDLSALADWQEAYERAVKQKELCMENATRGPGWWRRWNLREAERAETERLRLLVNSPTR